MKNLFLPQGMKNPRFLEPGRKQKKCGSRLLALTDTGKIIGIGDGLTAAGRRSKPSASLPGEIPSGAIEIACRITTRIIGNSLTIIGSQQILPVGITVCIGMGDTVLNSLADVAVGIVGVRVVLAVNLSSCQLALIVVGILGILASDLTSGNCLDVPHFVVGVRQAERAEALTAISLGVGDCCDLVGSLAAADITVCVVLTEIVDKTD